VVPLVETWGQTVVQDGGSVDHEISLFQLFSLCINKSFLVRKWIANHL